MAGQLFELDSWHNIKKILIFTFGSTLILELLGALIFFSIFKSEYSLGSAIFYSLFHSISAFCNAGVSFFHFLTEQNLERYNTNYLFLATTNNTLASLSLPLKFGNAIFHVISFKSCGFILGNLTDFLPVTIFLIMIIGLIGSSPGSTGSGIKITTFVLFLNTIKSTINGRTSVEAFEREIPIDQIYKAISIISLGVGWILFTTFCLLLTETNWTFLDVFFETMSAFSNVGFSLKGTQKLSDFGKLFIMATMFIGRIGSLTFILGLKLKSRKETIEFSYPEERVMLG